MKRSAKVLGALAILLLLVLALPLFNLASGGPSATALTVQAHSDRSVATMAALLEPRCGWCHVAGTKRPFYAGFPVAAPMIEEDVRLGLARFDLAAQLSGAAGPMVSEPALARLEREIGEGRMPPTRFALLHWDSPLGARDREAVLAWVKRMRSRRAAPGIPVDLHSALLRPLPPEVRTDPAKVALGEGFYNDKRLSGDGTISCATCHDLAKGGTDQAKVSTGIGGQKGGINSPTTFNAGLQFAQFWDGRAATLAEQAGGPPANPVEMGATWDDIVRRLSEDADLAARMNDAYTDGLTKANVTDAIAEFERTLLTPNSPFDRFLFGSADALSPEQKRGHAAFVARGCATCHVGELLGGRSFERMGRSVEYFSAGRLTEADHGRWNVTKAEKDRHFFKVPTLRNVALTWPYFHDGSQEELRDAVHAMAKHQLGVALPEPEAADMVRFLESLTGEYKSRPLAPPPSSPSSPPPPSPAPPPPSPAPAPPAP